MAHNLKHLGKIGFYSSQTKGTFQRSAALHLLPGISSTISVLLSAASTSSDLVSSFFGEGRSTGLRVSTSTARELLHQMLARSKRRADFGHAGARSRFGKLKDTPCSASRDQVVRMM